MSFSGWLDTTWALVCVPSAKVDHDVRRAIHDVQRGAGYPVLVGDHHAAAQAGMFRCRFSSTPLVWIRTSEGWMTR